MICTDLIALATAIAETPADATTNVEVLIDSNAGIATRVIRRAAEAAPKTTNSISLLIFLQTAKPTGHKWISVLLYLGHAKNLCSCINIIN